MCEAADVFLFTEHATDLVTLMQLRDCSCLLHIAGPLREAPRSWASALAALRAASRALDDAEVKQLLLDTISAGQTHAIVTAAISELDSTLAQGQRMRAQQPGDAQPENGPLSLLIAKTQHSFADVRTASLRCLRTLAGHRLTAEQVAAVTLAARSRLADGEPDAADAAAELLSAVAVRAALLAATGVNIGGMQDEPLWRSQVCFKVLVHSIGHAHTTSAPPRACSKRMFVCHRAYAHVIAWLLVRH